MPEPRELKNPSEKAEERKLSSTAQANEIRIALVLYGGVSLAVYMNGVVQELLALVRARRGAAADQAGNRYKRLLERLNSDVVVDMIAGNSAGGINGVLLAKALAAGTDLTDVKRLWRDTADMRELLDHKGKEPAALLNGSYMLRELEGCFEALSQEAERNPELAEERKRQIPILDLFVSATDLQGRRWSVTDSNGKEIEGLTHGVLLRRKYRTVYGTDESRGYEQNDFEGAYNDFLLSRMARATSAIPGVFPAQPFTMEEVYGVRSKYDDRDTVYLHDGLLTDNKPFVPVLDTILHRSADRKVDRWLLFVDASPDDTHLAKTPERYKAEPTIMEAAFSYLEIPRYQSIYRQILSLEKQQEAVESLTDVFEAVDEGKESASVETQPAFLPYSHLRLEQLDQSILANLRTYYRKFTGYRTEIDKHHPALLHMKAFLDSLKGDQLMLRVRDHELPDIEFVCRFFIYSIKKINKLMAAPDQPEFSTKRLSRQKDALWAAIEHLRQQEWLWWQLERELELSKNQPLQLSPSALISLEKLQAEKAGLEPLFNAAEDLFQDVRPEESAAAVYGLLQQSFRECLASLPDQTVLAEVLGFSQPMRELDFYDQLMDALRRFLAVDLFLYPLTYNTLGELNRIELIRIGSQDANSLGLAGSDKLIGEDLGAFAGFLDKQWRANDLMWGRLDTADILLSYLDKAYQRKEGSEQETAEWNELLCEVRADLFLDIIEEEMPFVDRSLAESLIPRLTGCKGEERMGIMRDFFTSKYTIGLKNWKDLSASVIANTASELAVNLTGVLKGHFRNRLVLSIPLTLLNLFLRGTGWIVKMVLPRK